MGFTKRLRRAGASGLLALLFSVSAVLPSATAVDAADVKVTGYTIMGSTLTVEAAHTYFEGCSGSSWKPNHNIQWLRDGVPLPGASWYSYRLTPADLGSHISAVVTASPVNCAGQTLTTPPSDAIRKEPARAEGFTGRNAFEVMARKHDGTLMLYLGQDNAKGWKDVRQVGPGWEGFSKIIAPGDMGSDGVNDLLTADRAGRMYQFNGTGDGGFHTYMDPGIDYGYGPGWDAFDKVVGPGDFNGDGLNDLLASEPNGDLYLFPSGFDRVIKPGVQVGHGWDVMDLLIGPGDWDGDGNVDVLAKDKSGRLYLYGGNGRGGWAVPSQIGQGWNALTMVGSAGDFNRDGFNDVHGVNAAGDLLMYYGDGRGGWKGVEAVGWGWNIFNGLY
ncbi:FG-GAP repeat domain-containing protein [Arthrobacter sp. alpha11c]